VVFSLGAVALVVLSGEGREASMALEELAQDQGAQAVSVADLLTMELHASQESVTPSDPSIRAVLNPLEHPGALHLFLLPPGESRLLGLDGRRIGDPGLRAPLEQGARWVRLDRSQAGKLGLPPRLAVAGLAWATALDGQRWGVATVMSALRERDRSYRARVRTIASLLVMGLIVLGFGGVALRFQREELQLARVLELNELQREKEARLNQANRAATMLTFAAGLAHEVSTPLGVIVGRAQQLLPKLKEDEKAHRALLTIQEEAEGLGRMVRRFLDLARGGSPALDEADPADLARGAAAMVEHRFREASAELKLDVAPHLPKLRGDARLLIHVLVNLLLNACDAAQQVKLAVGIEGAMLAFRVSDNGAGMAPEVAARVLEPFFSTKPAERGTGLGLAIAHEIVKMHRGTLRIESRPQQGTQVTVLLPI
jgi:signal transduction histidine kinase